MTQQTATKASNAPPIDVPQTHGALAVQQPQQPAHVEPEITDEEIDRNLGVQDVQTGHEVTVSPFFKIATPFPIEVQTALRAYRVVPDEMVEVKPNGQIYIPNRHAATIFDEVFGIGGWSLLPLKSVTERKAMRKGQQNEYEIITYYQTWRAYALGQYIRDVSGAGTYFSNNPEQNFSDAQEAAESYAINRLAKRLGIGGNVRDPIFAAQWIEKYAFEDPADKKWKRRPSAGGVPLPPNGSRSWTAALAKLFKPVVGEDTDQLADALFKLTSKAWGVEKASRSFRDLTNVEAYELYGRITSGELSVPTIAPRRASDVKREKEWPAARRKDWEDAHVGEGKPNCPEAGCQACNWDAWAAGEGVAVAVDDASSNTIIKDIAADPAVARLANDVTAACRLDNAVPPGWHHTMPSCNLPDGHANDCGIIFGKAPVTMLDGSRRIVEGIKASDPTPQQVADLEELSAEPSPDVATAMSNMNRPKRIVKVTEINKKSFTVETDDEQSFVCRDPKLLIPARSAMQSKAQCILTADDGVMTALEELG